MTRLKSLVTLTKESSNLFSEVAGNILNLLPGDWGTTIKRVFLILAFIIALPIVFFLLLLTCKCLKLMYWCYKPVIFGINFGIRAIGSMISLGVSNARSLTLRVPFRRMRETSRIETSVVHYRPKRHESATATLRPPRRPSRTSKSRTKLQ